MKNWHYEIGGSEFKIMRLGEAQASLYDSATMDQPQVVVDYIRSKLADSLLYRPDAENMMVVYLTVRNKAIGLEVVSNGTIDTVLAEPRVVFRSAIITNAYSVILAHNHPSGDPSPSESDIKATRDLMRAGKTMKIEVMDHVLGAQGRFTSLKQQGFLHL